jgi:hypothetical protein
MDTTATTLLFITCKTLNSTTWTPTHDKTEKRQYLRCLPPATTLNGPNARHHLKWALNSTAYAWYLSITNTCLCLPASLDVPVRSVKVQNPSGLSTHTTHHHRNWAFVIKWACHLASHRPNNSGTARCNAVVSTSASYAEVRSSYLRRIRVSVVYCCVPQPFHANACIITSNREHPPHYE